MLNFRNFILLVTSQFALLMSPVTSADSETQYTPNMPHANANWDSLTRKVELAGFPNHTPDARSSSITGDWLSPASWDAARWDGVTTYDPNKMSRDEFAKAICPSPDQIRGLREVYNNFVMEGNAPFADPNNPTQAQVDEWHRIGINHIRRLIDYTSEDRKIKKNHCTSAKVQWSDERKFTRDWDTSVYPGTCESSTNGHCGMDFIPKTLGEQAPYLPADNPKCNSGKDSEGVFPSVLSRLPWSIKWSRAFCNTLEVEGFWGGHIGPWFHREEFGFSFWDMSSDDVEGSINNVSTLRARWSGDLKQPIYGDFKAGDSVATVNFSEESHPGSDEVIKVKGGDINEDEFARIDTIHADPDKTTWIRYSDFDFTAGANVFYINTSSKYVPLNAKISVRLGSPDGELLGTVQPIKTSHKDLFVHNRLLLSRYIDSVDDLYLTFEGSGYNIVSFHFENEVIEGNVIGTNILAVDYSDISTAGLQDFGSKIGYINKPYAEENPWVKFDGFNLAGGAKKFYVTTSARFWPKNYQDPHRISRIRVRLGAPDGEIIATIVPKKTGSWSKFVEQAPVNLAREISGSKDIYLTFEGHGYDVKSFRFE